MKTEVIASFAFALICHALLLFGFRLGTPARPLAMSDDSTAVEVKLIAAAPEAIVAPPAEPVPEPTSMPEPETAPLPSEEAKPNPPPRPLPQKRSASALSARVTTAPRAITNARPRYRSNPTPDYPAEARRLHQEGVAVMSVEVSGAGQAASVSLKRSSGFPSLDQAALQAVRRWTFEPARAGGLAVVSRVEVPVRFSLSGR